MYTYSGPFSGMFHVKVVGPDYQKLNQQPRNLPTWISHVTSDWWFQTRGFKPPSVSSGIIQGNQRGKRTTLKHVPWSHSMMVSQDHSSPVTVWWIQTVILSNNGAQTKTYFGVCQNRFLVSNDHRKEKTIHERRFSEIHRNSANMRQAIGLPKFLMSFPWTVSENAQTWQLNSQLNSQLNMDTFHHFRTS